MSGHFLISHCPKCPHCPNVHTAQMSVLPICPLPKCPLPKNPGTLIIFMHIEIRQKNFYCVLYGGKWLSLSLKQIWLMLLDFIFLKRQFVCLCYYMLNIDKPSKQTVNKDFLYETMKCSKCFFFFKIFSLIRREIMFGQLN